MVRMTGFMIVLAIGMLAVASCSQGSPVNTQLQPALDRANDLDGHVLWGYYRLYIDPSGPTVDIVPVRNVEKHFNVKAFVNPPKCNDCIKIKPTGPFIDNILPLDITLKNPEQIKGYDVRGILLSDDTGADLDNPDSYTGLFDNGGPININPFKAYAKSEDDRGFGPGESFMEHYDLFLSKFKKVAVIDYAVDASWPTRAKEPYRFSTPDTPLNLDSNGDWTVQIYVGVFAAGEDVDEVWLDCSSLGFSQDLEFEFGGGVMWQILDFQNTHLASAGEYRCLAKASTASSNKYLYNYVDITVVEDTPIPSLQNDVQPIFDNYCTKCHQGSTPPVGLDLTEGNAFSNTVGVNSFQSSAKRIVPGDPNISYLMGKIGGTHMSNPPFGGSGDRMPQDGPPWMDALDFKMIADWIFEGALDN